MKRKTDSFTGTRPIFTGSPSIVQGGFNLDPKQNFAPGDVVPAGSLAIMDEEKRTVQIIKTAKVLEVAEDNQTVTLQVDEFHAPCFTAGDKICKLPVSGTYANALLIKQVSYKGNNYVITLEKASASGWHKGDVLEEVVDGSSNAAERGKANCVTICDVEVGEFETAIDVCADTLQYAMYENRVPAIPDTQKDSTKAFLAANPHIKLTKSH